MMEISVLDCFMTACHKNDVPTTVRNLMSLVNINERSSDGEPAPHKAMIYNNKEVVKLLLACLVL